MKRKGLTIKINLTNRWLYTLIALGILIAVGVGVYAVVPGVAPNPGHLLSQISPPAGCTAGQFVQFNGSNWVCTTYTIPTALYGWCGLVNTAECGRQLVCPVSYHCTSSTLIREPAYCSSTNCACRSGYTPIQLSSTVYSCTKN